MRLTLDFNLCLGPKTLMSKKYVEQIEVEGWVDRRYEKKIYKTPSGGLEIIQLVQSMKRLSLEMDLEMTDHLLQWGERFLENEKSRR